jgi:hypothetical protein
MSYAIKGMTAKFMLLYDGPFFISKLYPHSAYKLTDENGKSEFSKKALKPYREDKHCELGWKKEDRKRKGQLCEKDTIHV